MTGTGFLLFDGASHKQALAWLCQTFPGHSPRPLLSGTPYSPLAEIGPILLNADAGSPLHEAWYRGRSELRHAVWLKSDFALHELRDALQRRLRILSPDGRKFWLRLADARPLLDAWRANAQWPAGFWHGVRDIWLHDEDVPLLAWSNPPPERDDSGASEPLDARFTLDWPLLEALAHSETTLQEATT
ncbi:DUF4123 domain-containing protein [Pseudomonas lopnurensis]|uniref:DUF4123 domain-containing protein n=1 Tax=Pseudomonas lopnurensis TaxID=1477517 RepID=UPI0018794C57|nr:DUF4123 domain-containing protein [Pseudomonas lopnurensis]MBE7374636.1 DUF4123 domain-containing protein [Pseudomonas lopnurensis]